LAIFDGVLNVLAIAQEVRARADELEMFAVTVAGRFCMQ
jgi:hypothetical protein